MHRRVFSGILSILLVLSILGLGFSIQSVGTWTGETIYIRTDGSVYPSDAPVSTLDNITYIVTDDIRTTFGLGIVVERNNSVIDGADHTLQGAEAFPGIEITTGRRNVTIMNFKIEDYGGGILVFPSVFINITGNTIGSRVHTHTYGISLHDSSDITISENNITNSLFGIELSHSINSEVYRNELTSNHYDGIHFYVSNHSRISENNITAGYGGSIGIEVAWSVNVTISENTVADHHYGLSIGANSENNTVVGNNITNNTYGIVIDSSKNMIYHNNFINNTSQTFLTQFSANIWDNGYEGNYWSDGEHNDANGDGIVDTPYVIDDNDLDRYPLMSPYWYWINPIVGDINRDTKVDIKDVAIVAKAYGSMPGFPNWNPHADITGPEKVPDGKVDIRDVALVAKHYGEIYT